MEKQSGSMGFHSQEVATFNSTENWLDHLLVSELSSAKQD